MVIRDTRMKGPEGDPADRGAAPDAPYAPCRPALPPGFTFQEAWGFRDVTDRFSYQFCRVYGSPDDVGPRGAVAHLDEALSYWGVVWATYGRNGDEHPAGRWLTYAQARELSSTRLTFRRFSSPPDMHEEIPRLLRTSEIAVEARPPA